MGDWWSVDLFNVIKFWQISYYPIHWCHFVDHQSMHFLAQVMMTSLEEVGPETHWSKLVVKFYIKKENRKLN